MVKVENVKKDNISQVKTYFCTMHKEMLRKIKKLISYTIYNTKVSLS